MSLETAIIRRSARNPLFFSEDILGGDQPWARQTETLLALRDSPRVAVRSGHGVGKSWLAARAALWFLYSHPGSIVLTTAPTQRQVRSVLWSEIRRQHRAASVALGGAMTETRLFLDDDWFALGLSTDEPERFQGYHAEHILVIMDEAPGVPDEIYEAARGVLTSRHSRVLLIGNPTIPSGPFYDAFRSPEWKCIHIPCTECPNVESGKVIYPRLVTAEWVESQAREWGRESPAFRARVMGEFPEEAESLLVPLTWIHKAQERLASDLSDLSDLSDRKLGVDVARYGSDKTALVARDGRAVLDAQAWNGLSTMEAAGCVIRTATAAGVPAENISVDDTGVGGGVTDRLREQGWNVAAVIAGASADSPHFANRRAELFWRVREALNPQAKEPLALPGRYGALTEELTSIRYGFASSGKIIIESKEAIRARLGRSPDMADALALTFSAPAVVKAAQPRAWEFGRPEATDR